MSSRNEETALGVARARFVEGLPRKAGEIRGAVALLVATPDAERPREEMRRRLHALYASAQVFRIEPLAAALRSAIARLEAARDENRGLTGDDLDALTGLASELSSLATLPDASAGVSSIVAPRRASPSLLPPVQQGGAAPPPRPSTAPVRHPTMQDVRLPRPSSSPAIAAPEAGQGGEASSGAPGASSDGTPRRRSVTARFASFQPIGSDDDDEITAETPAPPPPRADEPAAAPPRSDPTEVTATPAGGPALGEGSASAADGGPRADADTSSGDAAAPGGDAAAPPGAGAPSTAAGSAPAAGGPAPASPDAGGPPDRRPSGSFTAGRSTGRFPVPDPDRHRPVGAAPEAVANVLVVDADAVRSALSALLPEDGYEVVGDEDPEVALRLARAAAPDVVLVDRTVLLRPGVDFVERLRSDPLTDFVPVVALLPEGSNETAEALAGEGLDGVVPKPLERLRLMDVLRDVTHGLTSPGTVLAVGDATPTEIADRLADEIRRGLVGALEAGGDTRVPLGDGAEILAAAWSAIARVRAHVGKRSDGRVRFRDAPARGGPALLNLVDPDADVDGGEAAAAALEDEVELRGRRILVADDDPSVIWFFASLLEEAGAVVSRARDGLEALAAARRSRPDVLISDILMPHVDGLGVCREVQRDPALADLPVILISWKEDFLQRMRELRAGARGYLRKEASGARILAKVRQVLRPRARLEAQLKAGGEVRGRIEGIGTVPLLRTVAGEWGDARVVVRDAFHLFEVDIRAGDLCDATRTAIDGAFARGAHVLPELLGSTAGRFTATRGHGAHRPTVSGSLDATLRRAMERVTAVVDAVSGTALARAASVAFDEEVVSPLLQASPERTRRLVEWLSEGKGPRDLIMEGLVSPQALEADLVDLARRGAIAEVRGPLGEDRIAEAARDREEARDAASIPAPAGPPSSEAPFTPADEEAPPSGEPPPSSLRPPMDTPAYGAPRPGSAYPPADEAAAPPSAEPPARLFSTPAHVPPPSAAPAADDAWTPPPGASEPAEGGGPSGEPAPRASDPGLPPAVVPPSIPDPFPAGDDTEEMDLPEGGFEPPPGAVDPFPPEGIGADHEEEDEDEETLIRDPIPDLGAATLDEDEPTRVRPSWPGVTGDVEASGGDPGAGLAEEAAGAGLDRGAEGAESEPPSPDASGSIRTSDPGDADTSGTHAPLGPGLGVDTEADLESPPGASAVPAAGEAPEETAPAAAAEAPPAAGTLHETDDTHSVPVARGGWVRFAVGLALMFLVGYGVMTLAYPYVEPYVKPYVEPAIRPLLERVRGDSPTTRSPLAPLDEPAPAAPAANPEEGADAPPGEGEPRALEYGGRADGVDERYDGEVGPSEGLVVVDAPADADGEPATVRIGDRSYGEAPLRLALPEGRYELVFEKPNGEVSYRFLMLRAGETRTLTAP